MRRECRVARGRAERPCGVLVVPLAAVRVLVAMRPVDAGRGQSRWRGCNPVNSIGNIATAFPRVIIAHLRRRSRPRHPVCVSQGGRPDFPLCSLSSRVNIAHNALGKHEISTMHASRSTSLQPHSIDHRSCIGKWGSSGLACVPS
jgi:hypothetical protein